MQIKIPNDSFSEYKNGTYLTPDELVVFAFIFKYRNLDDEVFVSVNILDYYFKFRNGNDRENKNYIRSLVLSMAKNKKFIETEQDDFIDKDLLYGKVRNDDSSYCGVDSSVFDALYKNNDVLELKLKFYIYSYIHCYGDKGRIVSYEKFSSLCSYFGSKKNHSVSKIKEMINEMDGEFIYRFSGDRKENSPEQEANMYFTVLAEKKKQDYLNHVHNKQENKKVHTDIPIVSGKEIDWGHWKDGNLTDDDYLLYAQQEHIVEFKKVADEKIKRITNNGSNDKSTYMVNKSLLQAREDVIRQKYRDKQNENNQVKDSIVEEYGVSIKLKDGTYCSHLDVIDWNEASYMVYVTLGSEIREMSINNDIAFYSVELIKHEFISPELLHTSIKDGLDQWKQTNKVVQEYEPYKEIKDVIHVKKESTIDITPYLTSDKPKAIEDDPFEIN